MWARLLTLMALGAVAVGAACSSATAPGPTLVGTWRVLESASGACAFLPDTFTVTFSGGRGDTLTVAMPPIGLFCTRGYAFDSLMTKSSPRADTLLFAAKDTSDTLWIEFQGVANAARDTMTGQIAAVGSGAAVLGSFVATKR